MIIDLNGHEDATEHMPNRFYSLKARSQDNRTAYHEGYSVYEIGVESSGNNSAMLQKRTVWLRTTDAPAGHVPFLTNKAPCFAMERSRASYS
jgi:hypothetical protein